MAYIVFFLSGCAALIYEMIWFRQLGLIFGNTVHAAATVLTAFMTGLAWGSWYFGRRADSFRNPLKVFGVLELAIGFFAVSVPFWLMLSQVIYRWFYQNVSSSLLLLTGLRFALSFLILLLPTFCMGGSLPVLTRHLVSDSKGFSRKIGWLYGVNTVGAVVGTFLGGFVLIPLIGVQHSFNLAVAISLSAGLIAVAVSVKCRLPQPLEPSVPAAEVRAVSRSAREWIYLIGMAIEGFVAMGLEVIWFRALILTYGSNTYSFSVVLIVFLAGTAIGSACLGWLAGRVKNLLWLLAVTQLVLGVYIIASLYWYDAQPEFLLEYCRVRGLSWNTMMTARFLITLKFLLIPTILMGFTFTQASTALKRIYSSSHAVSKIYYFNTIGDILGSFAAGFLILPALGMERSLLLMGWITLALCALYAVFSSRRIFMALVLAAACVTAGWSALKPPAWDHQLMASGPYFAPAKFIAEDELLLRKQLATEQLLFYREGKTATVSVSKTEEEDMAYVIDGKVEADTLPRGMLVQRMIGHLPMLFHPDPKKVMNLGLGAGVTFGSLGCYPVDHLEVVEIEPVVMDGAKVWKEYNHDIISHPDAMFTINDGRNHFFCTTGRYDVITSDPFEPVVGGAANLFTVEHFKLAKACLKEGGIMCQWVPMYEMSQEDFLTILRSFVHVFPDSALFFTGLDILMLGSRDGLRPDPQNVSAKYDIPAVSNSLAEIGMNRPEMILGMFVAQMSEGNQFVGDGPLNTDNRPVIEFSAPKSQMYHTVDRNQQILHDNFTDIPDFYLESFDEEARTRIRAQHDALKMVLKASILRAGGSHTEAFHLLDDARRLAPQSAVVANEISSMLLRSANELNKQRNFQEAWYQYQEVLKYDPDSFRALYQMVILAMFSNQPDLAGEFLEQGMAAYPDSPMFRALRGKYRGTLGDPAAACADYEYAVRLLPDHPMLWREYAIFLRQAGRAAEADEAEAKADKLQGAKL